MMVDFVKQVVGTLGLSDSSYVASTLLECSRCLQRSFQTILS